MSTYRLTSKPAPEPPILDWLKLSGRDLERYIVKEKVASIIGVNKMGDIETIYSPIIVHNAFASGSSAIIGNHSNKNTKPSFIYTNLSDIGSTMTKVICTYNDIHLEFCP